MKDGHSSQQDMKAMNHKQLASRYAVSHKTLKSWLKPFMDEIGPLLGKTFTIRQVAIIYDKLGAPGGDD